MATGIGLVFVVVGFLLVTDFRGGRRWILDGTQRSLDDVPTISKPLRRFNVNVIHGGDEESFQHSRTQVMPRIVGSVFILMGGLALIIGVVNDVKLLAHAL